MQVMEYLTLHDIPHRHCNPVLSHRMASQSSERPVGHMAAVCPDSLSYNPLSHPSHTSLPPVCNLIHYDYACRIESLERAAALPNRPLWGIILPATPDSPRRPPPSSTHRRLEGDLFRYSLECDMDPLKRDYALSATRPESSPSKREEYITWCNTKIKLQNHLQRSSPPLQPGEQNFPGKLPSFDEVRTPC